MPKKDTAAPSAGKFPYRRSPGEPIGASGCRSARMPVLRAAEDQAKPSWTAMLSCGAKKSGKKAARLRAETLPAKEEAATDEHTAADVVEAFCEHVPAMRVEPTPAELESLWMKCASFRAAVVGQALADQLSKATGEQNWQAQVRALHALTHLYTKGYVGKQIAQVVMNSARGLLQHLAKETEECHRGANLALLVAQLDGVVPPGEEVNVASEGGLMYFMGGEPKDSNGNAGSLAESSQVLKATAENDDSCKQAEPQTSSSAVETSVDLLSLSEAVEAASVAPEPLVAEAVPEQDLICLAASTRQEAASVAPVPLVAEAVPEQDLICLAASTRQEAAPVAPVPLVATSVPEQDLICLAASIRQEDLISLDAAPDVVDSRRNQVPVTTASAGVLVGAAPVAPVPLVAASVPEKDLICLATSIQQEDLISLDAAPGVVDSGKNHYPVTTGSAEVLVGAQELAGISFEHPPNTSAPKLGFGANLGGQRSSELTHRMAGCRPRAAACIPHPIAIDQFMEELLPRPSDPFASLAEHMHHQLK